MWLIPLLIPIMASHFTQSEIWGPVRPSPAAFLALSPTILPRIHSDPVSLSSLACAHTEPCPALGLEHSSPAAPQIICSPSSALLRRRLPGEAFRLIPSKAATSSPMMPIVSKNVLLPARFSVKLLIDINSFTYNYPMKWNHYYCYLRGREIVA